MGRVSSGHSGRHHQSRAMTTSNRYDGHHGPFFRAITSWFQTAAITQGPAVITWCLDHRCPRNQRLMALEAFPQECFSGWMVFC